MTTDPSNQDGLYGGSINIDHVRRVDLTDRIDLRLSGIISIRKQWPDQWYNGTMVVDPEVVVEFSTAGWESPPLCLMGTPITYIAMFKGKRDLVEFSLGANPVKPSIEVARDLLLPVVQAMQGYRPHNHTQRMSRDVTINRR